MALNVSITCDVCKTEAWSSTYYAHDMNTKNIFAHLVEPLPEDLAMINVRYATGAVREMHVCPRCLREFLLTQARNPVK